MRPRRHRKPQSTRTTVITALVLLALILFGFYAGGAFNKWTSKIPDTSYVQSAPSGIEINGEKIPPYSGKMSVEVNGNQPFFLTEDWDSVKIYSKTFEPLDGLGRARGAYAYISYATLPTGEREQLTYNPPGWIQANYDCIENGGWLYNRCHLLAYSLTGEQNEPRNLITGTRQFNIKGMLPYETQISQYIENFNGSCMYRVTPYYEGSNLVAYGVLMESYSIERPEEATFCVFVYNVQNKIGIDYATGESWEE